MQFDEKEIDPEKPNLNTNHIEVKTFVNTPICEYEIPYFRKKGLINWFIRVLKKNNQPKSRLFTLYKIRLINLGRFAEIAYKIPELTGNFETQSEFISFVYPLIKNHRNQLLYLCAVCLHNQHDDPPKELIKFLDDNIEAEMLFDIIFKGVDQKDLMSFMSAIMLVKGTSISFARVEDVLPVNTPE